MFVRGSTRISLNSVPTIVMSTTSPARVNDLTSNGFACTQYGSRATRRSPTREGRQLNLLIETYPYPNQASYPASEFEPWWPNKTRCQTLGLDRPDRVEVRGIAVNRSNFHSNICRLS